MNKTSLTLKEIHKEIDSFKEDIKEIDKNIKKLNERVMGESDSLYKSSMKFFIEYNEMAALNGARELLEDEIRLYLTAFNDELIDDLDYIINMFCISTPEAYTNLIIKARVDIVRFYKSKLSEKDYLRDTDNVKKKLKQIEPFMNITPYLSIPKKTHEIIKELIFYLTHADAQRFGYEEAAKKIRFSDEAISMIINTISRLKIKPKNQNKFNQDFLTLIYGDDINI